MELINANDGVLARSDDSTFESQGQTSTLTGLAQTMQIGTQSASTYSTRDYYTVNPKDAGMRVSLPGTPGTVTTYFVRVRSSQDGKATNPTHYLDNLTGGLTKGAYSLQIRLQEEDEFAGSTVRYADIRYATDGVEVVGKPEQSVVQSTTAETHDFNGQLGIPLGIPSTLGSSFDFAQDLGDVLTRGNSTLTVAGTLDPPDPTADIDWYKFSLNYEQIQAITGLNDGMRTFAAELQVNFADGLGRPDTTMALYDAQGTLLMISRNGAITDSLPRPNVGGIGADTTNLAAWLVRLE